MRGLDGPNQPFLPGSALGDGMLTSRVCNNFRACVIRPRSTGYLHEDNDLRYHLGAWLVRGVTWTAPANQMDGLDALNQAFLPRSAPGDGVVTSRVCYNLPTGVPGTLYDNQMRGVNGCNHPFIRG